MGLLPLGCSFCGQSLDEDEAVHTGQGMMHEYCANEAEAKGYFAVDNGDTLWPN